jgi:hypothetical protein
LDLTEEKALLDFYERSLNALEGQLSYVQAEGAKRRSRINDRALTMVPTWIRNPRQYKSYFIEFYADSQEHGISPASLRMNFEIRPVTEFTPEKAVRRRNNWRAMEQRSPTTDRSIGVGLSELTVFFPLCHALAEPRALIHWVKSLRVVAEGPLVAGHCGFALNDYRNIGSRELGRRIGEALASYSLRHPGFDWRSPVSHSLMQFRRDADDLIPMIKRVNWMTFIGQRSVEFLGGLGRIQSSLADEEIVIHQQPWGVIVQAGASPQIGDVGRRDFIPAYRKVASALRPIRLPRVDGSGIGFTDEAAKEWLNAFDRSYD